MGCRLSCQYSYVAAAAAAAGESPDNMAETLEPLFDMIVKEVAPPKVRPDAPLQMLVTNIDYDEHKGRIAIGRVSAGTITKAQQVS
jgi:GTP-binding protein